MKVYNLQSEKILLDELQELLKDLRQKRSFDATFYLKNKSKLLNNYLIRSKIKACVVAVSGGIDSAVTLGIVNYASLQKGSPIQKVVPILLPVFSKEGATNQEDALKRGQLVAKAFNLDPIKIDLTQSHLALKFAVDQALKLKGEGWASGQLVANTRTPAIYYTTSLLNQIGLPAIVCGTINRDEGAYLGYFGKASDGLVDIQLISDLHKSEVYQMAHLLTVPSEAINAIPSGDMYDGRVDEEVFGTNYDFVELYLLYLTLTPKEQERLTKNWTKKAHKQFKLLSSRLEHLHRYNKHKYLVGSPSIHLDIYERAVPGGWSV